MTLLRLTIGWAVVALWFVLFELVEQRITGTVPGERRFRAPLALYLSDAFLVTLFAGLWFASLGSGGWLLLFGLLGLLMEGPARYRDHSAGMDWGRRGLVRLASGVTRVVIAGGILAWRF
jgi:hypothetical protein